MFALSQWFCRYKTKIIFASFAEILQLVFVRCCLEKNSIQEKLFSQVVKDTAEKRSDIEKRHHCWFHYYRRPFIDQKQRKKRAPQAHSVKKGNTWHFGYKAHIGVDSKTGLVHTVKTTAANVHDACIWFFPTIISYNRIFSISCPNISAASLHKSFFARQQFWRNPRLTEDLRRWRSFREVGNAKRKNQNTRNHRYEQR